MVDIKPTPPTEYELRVIIWECKQVKDNDTLTDANDLFIKGCLRYSSDNKDKENMQETDLHYRARGGNGSFNWRMKFPISLPKKRPIDYPEFRLQLFDKDYFSTNDCI
eukprot:281528_1